MSRVQGVPRESTLYQPFLVQTTGTYKKGAFLTPPARLKSAGLVAGRVRSSSTRGCCCEGTGAVPRRGAGIDVGDPAHHYPASFIDMRTTVVRAATHGWRKVRRRVLAHALRMTSSRKSGIKRASAARCAELIIHFVDDSTSKSPT